MKKKFQFLKFLKSVTSWVLLSDDIYQYKSHNSYIHYLNFFSWYLLQIYNALSYCVPGAMAVICDVNEYRKCVANFKIPQINSLFDTLHTLCKLLQVSPENLKMVCSGDQLVRLTSNTTFIIT